MESKICKCPPLEKKKDHKVQKFRLIEWIFYISKQRSKRANKKNNGIAPIYKTT
jgi:hypothetical protein